MFNSMKERAVHLGLFLMGALVLVMDNGYAIGPVLLLLLSFSAYWDANKSRLERADFTLLAVLLLYFSVGLFDTLVHGQKLRNLDLFFRYLLAAWLLFYLARFKLNSSYLWYGYAVGSIVAGCYALYAKIGLGMARVEGAGLNSIHYGNLSMMLAFFCLAGIFWANKQPHRKSMIALMMVAALMGILASLLSGTRSGWVGFPFVLLALYVFFADHFPRRIVWGFLAAGLIILSALVALPQTNVMNRVDAAISDIQQYADGRVNTSVGLRFEMWKSGFYAFTEKPLIGWGEEEFYRFQKKAVNEYGLHPAILNFNHLHNQYMEELAKRGIIGLVALMLLFWVPFKLFSRRLRADDETRALAAAGVVAVICMADFCLTQAMLRITSGATFFVFNLIVIWSVMRSCERQSADQFRPGAAA